MVKISKPAYAAGRPEPHEYDQFYSDYLSELGDINPIEQLKLQSESVVKIFSGLTNKQAEYSYAKDKWSLKEVLGHLNDSERIFCYRALSIARRESQSLPGFEQDDYVREGNFNLKNINDLIEDYKIGRKSTIRLFGSFDKEIFLRMGKANNKNISVRAILYIILGHEKHHLNILNEKYLLNLPK